MKQLMNFMVLGFLCLGVISQVQAEEAKSSVSQKETAETGKDHRGGKRSKWFKDLGLSEDQMQQIKSIRESAKETAKSNKERVKKAHEAMRVAIDSSASDAELTNAFNEMLDARQNMMKFRFDQMIKVRGVLTEEQKKKFKGFGRLLKRRHDGKGKGRGNGPRANR